jgi:hypothetical protein
MSSDFILMRRACSVLSNTHDSIRNTHDKKRAKPLKETLPQLYAMKKLCMTKIGKNLSFVIVER